MIISLNKDNFSQEVENATKPVVIDVFATWCGPCMHMKPIFEQLAQELGDKYSFAQINVDESRELAMNYKVTSVPTFIFVKNNQVLGKDTGSMSKEDLKSRIEELFRS